jgi:hypothetical protein
LKFGDSHLLSHLEAGFDTSRLVSKRNGQSVGAGGMMSENIYTIIRGYKVFEGPEAKGEPMDEPSEVQLLGWLTSRRYSVEEADAIIKHVDEHGSMTLPVPKNSN